VVDNNKVTLLLVASDNSDLLKTIDLPINIDVIELKDLMAPVDVNGTVLLITPIDWLEINVRKQYANLVSLVSSSDYWLVFTEDDLVDSAILEWLEMGVTDIVGSTQLSMWIHQLSGIHSSDHQETEIWFLSGSQSDKNQRRLQDGLESANFNVSHFSSLESLPADQSPALMICTDLSGLVFAKHILKRADTYIAVLRITDFSQPGQSIIPSAINLSFSVSLNELKFIVVRKALNVDQQKSLTNLYSSQITHAIDQHASVSLTDIQGRIMYANDQFCRASGYSRKELIGANHNLVKSDLHDEAFYQDMWSALKKGDTWKGAICNKRKQGAHYWVEATITPCFGSSGEIWGYCTVRTDISSLKTDSIEQHAYADMLRQSQAFANVGTWDWNIETGELFWSEKIAPLFGYEPGQVETSYENFINAVHPDDRALVEQSISKAVKDGKVYEIEHRVVWQTGELRWLLERGAVTYDSDGNPAHMLGVVQDIHDRKMTEIELAVNKSDLAQANTMMRQVIDNIPDRVFWMNTELNYVGGNEAFYQDAGLKSEEDLVGLSDRDMPWFKSSVDYIDSVISDVLDTHMGRLKYKEERTFADGNTKTVISSIVPLKNSLNEMTGVLGVYQDITESQKTQDLLKKSEERLSLAIEGAGDGIWDWDITSGDMKFSRLYMQMLGFEEFELPHHVDTWVNSVHPDDIEGVNLALSDYLEGKRDDYIVELRLRRKDETYLWVLCRGAVVARFEDGNPKRMIGIHSDIHEQKSIQTHLDLFRKVFDSSSQCIVIANSDQKVIFSNQAFLTEMRLNRDDMVNENFTACIAGDKSVRDEILESLLKSRVPWEGLTERVRNDGSKFSAYNSFGLIEDVAKNITHIFVIFIDFTEELERRKDLSRATKMAEKANKAKSEFLSNMSHELRTPMNSVIGFAQLLEHDEDITVDQRDNIKEILRAGGHLLDLINDVLDLSKIESGRIEMSMESVEVSSLIKECYDLTVPMANDRELTFNINTPKLVSVFADRVRLKQVLLNLISNGIKYNSVKGSITITVDVLEDKVVRINISDTGPGISKEQQYELYQPFNRLGADLTGVEGTGIGLTITERLVTTMNGALGCDSDLGKGSTFWVELPLANEQQLKNLDFDKMRTVDDVNQQSDDYNYTVICIDDNPANLKLISQILTRMGKVNAIAVQDPELGIETALSEAPDLILLDINMPRLNGYDVLKILQASGKFENVPIIAVTANAMPSDIKRGLEAGFSDYLTKPLNLKDTQDIVSRHLNDHQKR